MDHETVLNQTLPLVTRREAFRRVCHGDAGGAHEVLQWASALTSRDVAATLDLDDSEATLLLGHLRGQVAGVPRG